ncbi:MAG: acetylglutamate kinase [Pseudomonadota bacterium]
MSQHIDAQTQAELLSEALPHMQRYDRQTVVVKYGGHAMGDAELSSRFARDIVLLKQSGVNPVVVHGGGPQIGGMLDRLQIKSEFRDGLRVTDGDTISVVEMVLAGSINKSIVAAINAEGGRAVGISGKDGGLMRVRKLTREAPDPESNLMQAVDLGFVGEPETVDPHVVNILTRSDLIPVIAPTASGPDGATYNVNADTFAGALASAMQAKRLLLLTDVPGVLDKSGSLVAELTAEEARALIANETISGGMIPKIESCLSVIEAGVEAVVILNGKVPHAVLLELLTVHGAGTLLRRDA